MENNKDSCVMYYISGKWLVPLLCLQTNVSQCVEASGPT